MGILLKEIKFRWLAPDEFERVRARFDANNWAMPHPDVAGIWAGEEDGEIICFCCVQSIPHIGPALIDPDYRGSGIWRIAMTELKEQLGDLFNGAILVAMVPATEHIAEELGMKRSEGVLYLGDFAKIGG